MNSKPLLFIFIFITLILCSSSANAAIPIDYQFYFDFEEGTGSTAYNANTSNANMTVYGSDVWSVSGAAHFNGSAGSYGQLPTSSDGNFATNNLTLVANCTPANDTASIFISKQYAYQLRMSSSKMYFNIWNSSNTLFQVVSSGTYNLTDEYVVVGKFNGTHMTMYVDQELIGTTEFVGTMRSNSADTMAFGSWKPNNGPEAVTLYDIYIYDYDVDDITVFGGAPSEEVDNPYISYNVGFDCIYVSGSGGQGISLHNISVDPDVSDYVSQSGTIMTFEKPLWIKNGAGVDFRNDSITELRIDLATRTNQILSSETGTTAYFKDDLIISNYNTTSNSYRTDYTDTAYINGLYSCDNITFNNLGALSIREVPNNTIFSNVTYSQDIYASNPCGFYGSSNTGSAPDKYAYNVTFNSPTSSNIGLYISAIDGLTINSPDINYNSSVTTAGAVVTIDECLNFSVSDTHVASTNSGIVMKGSAYGTVSNTHINGNWYGEGDPTGGHGVYTIDGGRVSAHGNSYITISDFECYNMGYAGVGIKAAGDHHITILDGVVHTGYHNGMDIRGDNHYVENVSSANYSVSDGQNWAIAGGNNSYYKDIIVDGKGVIFNGGYNNTIENILIKNASLTWGDVNTTIDRCVGISNQHDSKIINMTFENPINPIQNVIELFIGASYPWFDYSGNENFSIIDADLYNADSTVSDIYMIASSDVKLINVNATVSYYNQAATDNTTIAYYLNARVLNTTGYAVSDAEITLNTTAYNGFGNVITTAYTDSDGYLYDSGNRSNWVALESGVSTLVTASKGTESDTETITVSASEYSSDVSDLNGTLYIFVLDVEGGGEPVVLEISSFTPTDTTPSTTYGTGQTFTVNLNTAGNVTWLINGTVFQTNTSVTSASYTNSTASVGEYVVLASAYDGSTYANQSWIWTVTEVPVTPTDTVTWDNILSRAQSDTENAISLGAILPVVIISGIIISLIIGMAYGVIEFEAGVKAILVMLVVSLILMIALPIFNSLYS